MSAPEPTRTGVALGPPGDATRSGPAWDPDVTQAQTSAAPGGPPVAPPGYEVLGELGRGGMGVVYHVRHAKLNRPAALKTTIAGNKADPKDLIRFLAEAEAVAAVRHPHVVQVYEYGDYDGRPFLALELCPNGNLTEKLRAAGKLPPRAAAELVAKLADAVQAAHDQGIVHRDLKPSNVLFDSVQEPKVTDFGLAKKVGGFELTKTHAVMGTPSYMAPEQARGETKFVGPAADVWALGVILFECLTGQRPFEADDSWALLQKVMNADPAPLPSDVPRDLALITRTCLAKAPHERFESAKALADDLNRYLAGLPISVRPAGPVERLTKWVKRNPVPAALVASLLIGTTAATALAIQAVREADRADQEASNARQSAANEKAAADRADAEAATAKAKAAEAQRLLGLIAVNEGVRLQNQSDATGAALHFARVLELDPDNPVAVEAARMRIGAALQYTPVPLLAQLLTVPPGERVVTVSPDNRRVASVRGTDGVVRVWDVEAAKPVCEVPFRDVNTECTTFSPDGNRLFLSRRTEPGVALLDTNTGRLVPTPPTPKERVILAHFSVDGSRLFLLTRDSEASVWDSATGKNVVPSQPVSINKCESPVAENRNRAVFVEKSAARVYDLTTGVLVGKEVSVTGTSIRRATFGKSGDRLGLVLEDETVLVWDVDAGRPVGAAFPVDGVPSDLLFFPGGECLVMSSDGIRPWVPETGEPICPLVRTKDKARHVVLSPVGDWFAVTDAVGRVIVHMTDDGSEVARTTPAGGLVMELMVSRDGLRVLPFVTSPILSLWGPGPGSDGTDGPPEVLRLRHEAPVRFVRFGPDGQSLLTLSGDRVVRVWAGVGAPIPRPLPKPTPDPTTTVRLAAEVTPFGVREVWRTALGFVELRSGDGRQVGRPLGRNFQYVFFTPDNRALVLQPVANRAQLVSAETGEPIGPSIIEPSSIELLRLSPDRSRWATVVEGRIRLWDAATGRPLTPDLSRSDFIPFELHFSVDSSHVYVIWNDGLLEAWDVANRRTAWTRKLADIFSTLRQSPDGRTLLVYDTNDLVLLLSAAQGENLLPALRSSGDTALVEFSRDGRYLVTTGQTHLARVWDLATGRRVGLPADFQNGSEASALSPNGRYVAGEVSPQHVRVFEVATGLPVTPTLAFPDYSDLKFLRDSQSVTVRDEQLGDRAVRFPADPRPTADLIRLCELLAAQQVDDTGTLVPLTADELAERWTELKAKGTPELTNTPADRLAWHRSNAVAAAYDENWYAAAFHFRKLAQWDPANPEWARRLSYAEWYQPAPELAPPPRRKGR